MVAKQGGRVQSPSSINLFKQCPRRYFYSYILRFPTKPNIHLIRGNVVHSALENFFDIKFSTLTLDDYKLKLTKHLKQLFSQSWQSKKKELSKLGLLQSELEFYYEESTFMLANWLNDYLQKIKKQLDKNDNDLKFAFNRVNPLTREELYKDDELKIKGYVDAIHRDGDSEDVVVIDYKTSKKDTMTPAYRLQLGLYALMYQRKHGVMPKKVGIWFLKTGEKHIDVTQEMIQDALFEVEQIHAATQTTVITDYPKKVSPLCKYSTGQCDFYDMCMRERK
ncbi:PD-(D/E)XK nuclease family protein [Candidatus Woesearchaeota archaeon]|nr:PD-(D/E)XK nuclease family protein [Candidatus Woesearchaeota archaeon]